MQTDKPGTASPTGFLPPDEMEIQSQSRECDLAGPRRNASWGYVTCPSSTSGNPQNDRGGWMGAVLREPSSKFTGTANKTLGRWQRPKRRVMVWLLNLHTSPHISHLSRAKLPGAHGFGHSESTREKIPEPRRKNFDKPQKWSGFICFVTRGRTI